LFGLLLLLAAGALGFLYYRAKGSLPPKEGAFRVAGLSASVEVIRDGYGIPHVYGATLTDVARAVGYLHAQDRLFQMEISRRMGSGRLAELFGEEVLALDRRARRLGLGQAAEAELARMDAEARELLEAYAGGVNAYIESHADSLPPEFQILRTRPSAWAPADSLAIAKWMSHLLSFNGSVELLRARLAEKFGLDAAYLLTGLPPPPAAPASPAARAVLSSAPLFASELASLGEMAALLGAVPPIAASNAWVVSGARSASGKPLLASDPHLAFSHPSVWYQVHLSGGGLNVAGGTLPGLPLVIIGHNERIAWGATALVADVQDHYLETLNPSNPREYAVGEGWASLETYSESILVKDRPAVALEVSRTRHGVIVSDAPRDGKVLALRWEALWTGDALSAFLRVNRASSWLDFTEALRTLAAPPLAFLYADVDGNIGYFPAGEIPLRPTHDGALPVDGASGGFEWQGSLAHELKPFLFNPETGTIVSANQQMAPPESGSPFGRDAIAPFRANRIAALLAASGKLSASDFERIQSDRYDSSTEPILRPLVAISPPPGDAALAHELLRGWDGQMKGGPAPALFQAFYLELLENTFADDLGDELYAEFLEYLENGYGAGLYPIIELPSSPWWDDRGTPAVEDRSAILARSLAEAVALLRNRQGEPGAWDWGALHEVRFEHPLGHRRPLDLLFNRGPARFGGSTHTVANAWTSLRQPFRAPIGTSFRMVVDLGNLNAASWVIPTGASGHFLSPHYFDQNTGWLSGQNHPLLFERGQVEGASLSRVTLTP
jgi:penicillin amidase